MRAAERGRVALLFALGGALSLAQTLGLAASEALFLARLGAERLPVTFVLASLVTVGASLAYAARVGRARNDTVFVEILGVGAAATAIAGALAASGQATALPALLCLFFAIQAVALSHFWTLTGDLFDTLAAKRVVPLFTVGMSAGGATGGGIALLAGRLGAPELLLALWALVLGAAGLGVRLARPRFTRWGAMEATEEDETSVAGLASALRYLRGRPLGRGLLVSTLAMVMALFTAQFLYSEIFAVSFPSEAELAAFFGIFLGLTNLAEIAFELWVTPRLIRRGGVAGANLVHPTLTLLSFVGLAAHFALPAAVASRVAREPLENALAGPVRNLVYNGLPQRLRARVRAVLEGVVLYAGMSVAGAVLLVASRWPAFALSVAGGGLALLYLGANLYVRRAYVAALVAELRSGALELGELGGEVGGRELTALARLWERLLAETRERPPPLLAELAALLASHRLGAPLRAGLEHPLAAVRALALRALAEIPDPADERAADFELGLRDPAPPVRAAALASLPDALATRAPLRTLLRAQLEDDDPELRAEAAHRLGAEGEATLLAMADDPEPQVARAALVRLSPQHWTKARARAGDSDAGVRAACFHALARARTPGAIDAALGRRGLADSDPRVRRAAVAALAAAWDPEALEVLAAALGDPAREVRAAAIESLAARGEAALRPAREALASESEAAAASALRVLARVPGLPARGLLATEYRRRVRAAWTARLCAETLRGRDGDTGAAGEASPLPLRFLRLACDDAAASQLRLAFAALAALEDEDVVRRVERTLRLGDARARGDALEVLSNLGPREVSEALAAFLEPGPSAETRAGFEGLVAAPRDLEEALWRAREVPSRFARAAATLATAGPETASEESIVSMERLLFLRQIPLFSQLRLEELEAVERIARTVEYVDKETIVREGTPGEELYLLEAGEVEIVKGYGTAQELRLNRLGPGSTFGEMSVLDGAPRSATVVAAGDARLLVLDGARLRELIHERPEMAFEIFRVLAARVRAAEARLAEADPRSGGR